MSLAENAFVMFYAEIKKRYSWRIARSDLVVLTHEGSEQDAQAATVFCVHEAKGDDDAMCRLTGPDGGCLVSALNELLQMTSASVAKFKNCTVGEIS